MAQSRCSLFRFLIQRGQPGAWRIQDCQAHDDAACACDDWTDCSLSSIRSATIKCPRDRVDKTVRTYTDKLGPRNGGRSEETLQIKPLSEHVGAEISGVNLAAHLSDDIFKEIDDAYNRYSVRWSFTIRS